MSDGAHVEDDKRQDGFALRGEAMRDLIGVHRARWLAADQVLPLRLDPADGSDEDGSHFLNRQVERLWAL